LLDGSIMDSMDVDCFAKYVLSWNRLTKN
jgi:hypothetical protein